MRTEVDTNDIFQSTLLLKFIEFTSVDAPASLNTSAAAISEKRPLPNLKEN